MQVSVHSIACGLRTLACRQLHSGRLRWEWSPSPVTQATADPGATTESTTPRTAATLVSTETRLDPSPQAEAQIPALVAGNTAFGVELFKAARGADAAPGDDLVLAIQSLSRPAMTYAGTRGGIEAAAGSMVVQVGGMDQWEINFDRPVLFLIRHVPSGTILLMRQVMNPA